jgi:hypothetical protein
MGTIDAPAFKDEVEELSEEIVNKLSEGVMVQGHKLNTAARIIGALAKRLGPDVFLEDWELEEVEGVIFYNVAPGKLHIEAK